MFFMFLVFLAAFALELIGTWVSVIGLSSMFAASQVVIILAICLDFAKVITVSYTYTYWKDIKFLGKVYYLAASTVLVIITSAGAFGYLSGEFQKAISDTNQQSVQLAALIDEQGRNQKRKEAIDKQISQLPESNVRGRTQLIKQFGPEIKHINDRLIEIDKELPALKIDSIKKNVEVGPIIYVAEAFHTTPELAVKWVILTIIFVFDPLAISLLLAGNALIAMRQKKKAEDALNKEVPITSAEQVIQIDEPPIPQPEEGKELKAESHIAVPCPELEAKVENATTIKEEELINIDKELTKLSDLEELKFQSELKVAFDEAIVAMIKDEAVKVKLPSDINTAEVKAEEVVEYHTVPTPYMEDIDTPTSENFVQLSNPFMQIEQDSEREIITLEQIMKPVHPVKIHKSTLDDVDAKFGDLEPDEGVRHGLKHLFGIYQADKMPD
jgi:hypothetical protein